MPSQEILDSILGERATRIATESKIAFGDGNVTKIMNIDNGKYEIVLVMGSIELLN